MKIRTIVKKLLVMQYTQLAISIYKLVLKDPIYFDTDDILMLIYYKYEQTKDDKLAFLHQEITKNGVLIKLNLI